MRRLLALAFAAWLVIPAHAEEWDWDIGYKRPGFVHHHNLDHLSNIDRERVRLYREEGLEAGRRQSTTRSVVMNTRSTMTGAFTASNPYAG